MHPFHDLNEEERAEYKHLLLLECAYRAYDGRAVQGLYQRAHDRQYGDRTHCPYCVAPRLNALEKVFMRPSVEPTTTLEDKKRALLGRQSGRSARMQNLISDLFGEDAVKHDSQGSETISD